MGSARLGGSARPGGFGSKWRIKLKKPRLRIGWLNPVNFLTKLRDAYVNMMLALAEKTNLSAAAMSYPSFPYQNKRPARVLGPKDNYIKAYLEHLRRQELLNQTDRDFLASISVSVM